MRTSALFALAAGARLAAAHTTVYAIWVNDVDQGLGNSADGYIRSPPNNNPILDVTSKDLTCNVNNVATAKTIEVKGGDKITFEWHHNNRDASDDIIASSHHGPVQTYIAPTKGDGAGAVWVKLAEEGYADGKWGVDNLITNKGKHSITLPDLAAGEYLLRPEIIALHEANRQGGAQFYTECVQIKVTSSGAKSLPAGVSIPGVYTATDPGVLFDIYNTFTSYPIPGPAVWDGASSGSATSAAAVASSAPATSAVAAATSLAAVVSSATPSATPVSSSVVTSPAAVATSPAAVVTNVLTTLVTSVKKTTTVVATPVATPTPSPTAGASTGTVQKYAQCGGSNYTGATACADGWTCKAWNPYYSQCVSA